MNNYIHKESNRGFTIIELLIVIVIIAILVAITAVGYNGVTKSATAASVQSDLKQAKTALDMNKARSGTYPASLATNVPPINQPKNTTLTYTQLDGGQGFTLTATSNSMPDIVFKTGSTEGGIIAVVPSPNIQTITKAACPTELTQVKDARDNNSYYVKKLGNDCWMLTNLAYGGGTANGGTNTYGDVINQGDGTPGTNTINGPDNSGSPTYTLAKYYIPPGSNPTIDPTPPSTSTDGGATNPQYGYLYNWCAAMGGQNTAACADSTSPGYTSSVNICPAGWILPGRNTFTSLNTTVNDGLVNTDVGLRTKGLIQYGGIRYSNFTEQGVYGNYWTNGQLQSNSSFYIELGSTLFSPNGYMTKFYGVAVRCVAQ